MTGWRRARIAIGLTCASVLLTATPTRAGPDLPPGVEEIEHRLKTAGVDEALRQEIHAAIARAVDYLLAAQASNGSIVKGLPRGTPYSVGSTALSALALAHSGLPGSGTGARKALDWLAPPGKKPRNRVSGGVYEGGICAMLLDALDARPDVARRIVTAMMNAQHTGHGWWAYCTDDCTGCSWGAGGKTVFNLSTTQFGGLALWAGERAGADVDPEDLETAWTLHLESLLQRQLAEGDWPYDPSTPRGSARTLNHAAMGYANLELAAAYLRDRLKEDVRLVQRVRVARRAARAELTRDGLRLLDTKTVGGFLDLYGYYALEKACIFANIERLDGRRWYVDGARRLLATQRKDGSWIGYWTAASRGRKASATGDTVATAFSLLFLLRVSETYRPTTPRDVPVPKWPVAITPSDDDPPGNKPVLPGPTPAGVPLADAVALNEEFETAISKRTLDLDEVRHLVERIRDVQRRVVADGPPDDLAAEMRFAKERPSWRARLDTLLAHAFDRCGGPRRDAAEEVAILIAATIGEGEAGAAARLMAKLPRAKRVRLDDLPSPGRLDAAMAAIARAGAEDAIPFLVHLIGDDDERRDLRLTRAALHGLATASAAPGDVRRDAVRRLLLRFASVEKSARSKDDDLQTELEEIHWELLETRATDAIDRLATDPETGRPPDVRATLTRSRFRQLQDWFDDHKDPKKAPWREP